MVRISKPNFPFNNIVCISSKIDIRKSKHVSAVCVASNTFCVIFKTNTAQIVLARAQHIAVRNSNPGSYKEKNCFSQSSYIERFVSRSTTGNIYVIIFFCNTCIKILKISTNDTMNENANSEVFVQKPYSRNFYGSSNERSFLKLFPLWSSNLYIIIKKIINLLTTYLKYALECNKSWTYVNTT